MSIAYRRHRQTGRANVRGSCHFCRVNHACCSNTEPCDRCTRVGLPCVRPTRAVSKLLEKAAREGDDETIRSLLSKLQSGEIPEDPRWVRRRKELSMQHVNMNANRKSSQERYPRNGDHPVFSFPNLDVNEKGCLPCDMSLFSLAEIAENQFSKSLDSNSVTASPIPSVSIDTLSASALPKPSHLVASQQQNDAMHHPALNPFVLSNADLTGQPSSWIERKRVASSFDTIPSGPHLDTSFPQENNLKRRKISIPPQTEAIPLMQPNMTLLPSIQSAMNAPDRASNAQPEEISDLQSTLQNLSSTLNGHARSSDAPSGVILSLLHQLHESQKRQMDLHHQVQQLTFHLQGRPDAPYFPSFSMNAGTKEPLKASLPPFATIPVRSCPQMSMYSAPHRLLPRPGDGMLVPISSLCLQKPFGDSLTAPQFVSPFLVPSAHSTASSSSASPSLSLK